MARFALRIWLPDRPGALGRVATALGSIGASLVAIDILEQGGGYAIDELVVDAVDSVNADEKLVAALTFVEGVSVEDIRVIEGPTVDPRVDALQTAAELVEQSDPKSLLSVLAERAKQNMETDWCVVFDGVEPEPLLETGTLPSLDWVRAFVQGSRLSTAVASGHHGPEDIAWTELGDSGVVIVLGRDKRPFRSRERLQLAALARIAGKRLTELRPWSL